MLLENGFCGKKEVLYSMGLTLHLLRVERVEAQSTTEARLVQENEGASMYV